MAPVVFRRFAVLDGVQTREEASRIMKDMSVGRRRAPLRLVAALLIILYCFQAEPAWAHRMLIRQEEPGVLRVFYEGGQAAGQARVTLLDAEERELGAGPVDEDGRFTFDPRLRPARAVADDGLGHRAVLNFAADDAAEVPLYARAIFGLALLLFAAGFFYYRAQKKG